ncbi:MAG: hypothetical protein ACE5KS_04885, partial [Woeseiaceae bacterium]
MPVDDPLTELLACPRCDKSPLSLKGGKYRCDACQVDFPDVCGIPWTFADPDASLAEWRNRLHFELARLGQDAQLIEHELKSGALHALTRKRLEQQKAAVEHHRESLRKLL